MFSLPAPPAAAPTAGENPTCGEKCVQRTDCKRSEAGEQAAAAAAAQYGGSDQMR